MTHSSQRRFLPFLVALIFGCAGVAPVFAADAPTAFSVKVTGSGPPMILIPGLACTGDVWDSTVAHFKDRYTCHVLTLAGFGGPPPLKAPMLDTVRAQLVDYIRDQKLDHPVIVGHSLGGFLAFWLAATDPGAVGPVVAVDGLPFLPAAFNPTATEESVKPMAEGMRARIADGSREDYLANSQRTLEAMISDPAKVKIAHAWAEHCDIPSVALAMSEMMSKDLRPKLAAIQSPVLLIGAGNFGGAPDMLKEAQAKYEDQVSTIPHHKVVMAANAKHFIMFDDPKFLFQTMDAFLQH